MAILTANHLTQSFGDKDLFEDLALELNAKERVGLVGPNGCGKTTLLLILAGLQEPSGGSVQRHRELMSLGYLRQEAVLTFAGQDNTLYEEMLSVFAEVRAQEAELLAMTEAMARGEMGQLEAYGRLQELFEHNGGYQYHNEIKRVLLGLGFSQEEWETPLAHLSGGQKTRLLLGRLLLEKPDLLILDEPTNHLDVVAIEWLEQTLRQWEGALLIVSHDRFFLDRIVGQIWDLTPKGLKTYRGNYTTYVRQRQEAWEREYKLFTSEAERMAKEIEFVQKHIADGQTDMAKGKLRRLTRDLTLMKEVGVVAMQGKNWAELGERVRPFSLNEAIQHFRALKTPDNKPPTINLRLKAKQLSGRVILRVKKLQIGYEERPLFSTGKIKLERQDCVALIGANGSGKTTFLRTLLGELRPLSGDLNWGENVQIGYFAQAHDQLNLNNRVIDEITKRAKIEVKDARNHLAQYLFRNEDVFKKVSALSGGERGRLALAILALEGANFLLLDEPTNHLDIPSQEAVQEVLERFDGTILLVSHDRYLVSHLATQIWELRDNYLHLFEGTYEEFLMSRGVGMPKTKNGNTKVALPQAPAESKPVSLDWVQDLVAPPVALDKKEKKARRQRLQEIIADLEEREVWLTQIERDIEVAERLVDDEKVARLKDEYRAVQEEIELLSAEWEELQEL